MGTQKTLRVAIVGLSIAHQGTIGPERPYLIHNFRQMEGVEVVAYCEEDQPEILKDADVHHPEAGQYTSVDELIANEDFDIACVVLAPSELPKAALKLAEAGKHMFLDKQFARTSADLVPVVKAVRKSGVKTTLSYGASFHPAMQDLRRMIGEGILGRPVDIECRQVFWKVGPGGNDPNTFSYRKATQGGGVLHYVGSSWLALMRFLMGCEAKSVQAMTGRPIGHMDEPLEDIAIVAMEYENGAYGGLHAGYTKPVGIGPDTYDSAMVYRGLEGWADWTPVGSPTLEVKSAVPEWGGAPERTFHYDLTPKERGFGGYEWMHIWLESFIHAIRADEQPYQTIEDGLKILQSIDAAYESARTGRRVEVQYGV